MLLNTPSSTSVTSRLPVPTATSGTLTSGALFLVSSIAILLKYSRFKHIRTSSANGVRLGRETRWGEAPDPDGPGASVPLYGLLAGFDHVGDQRVTVLAVLAHAIGRVG